MRARSKSRDPSSREASPPSAFSMSISSTFVPSSSARGKPFFAGPRPPLRLVASEEFGDTVKLTYATA